MAAAPAAQAAMSGGGRFVQATRRDARSSLWSWLRADLAKPGHLVLVLLGLGVFAASVLPGALDYTAAADRLGLYDPHYVEHMIMQLAGLVIGFPFAATFAALARAAVRRAGWVVIVGVSVLDLAAMNPAVDLVVDRWTLLHAGEHAALLALNAALGAAWGAIVGEAFWAFLLLAALMVLMVLGESA